MNRFSMVLITVCVYTFIICELTLGFRIRLRSVDYSVILLINRRL